MCDKVCRSAVCTVKCPYVPIDRFGSSMPCLETSRLELSLETTLRFGDVEPSLVEMRNCLQCAEDHFVT